MSCRTAEPGWKDVLDSIAKVSSNDLDAFLVSHAIPVPELRADDFDAFIRRRASALLSLIEDATGKTVTGRDSEETMKAFGGVLV